MCDYRGPTALVPQLEGDSERMEKEDTQTGQGTLSTLVRAPKKDPKALQPLFCILSIHISQWVENWIKPGRYGGTCLKSQRLGVCGRGITARSCLKNNGGGWHAQV